MSKDSNLNGHPGRVLHIGVSYYNNWYLAKALRPLGWKVEVLMSKQEGAELYAHGYDFLLRSYEQWDGKYQKARFDLLSDTLRTYIQEEDARSKTSNFLIRLFEKLIAGLLSEASIDALGKLIDQWGDKYPMRRFDLLSDILQTSIQDEDAQSNASNFRIRR